MAKIVQRITLQGAEQIKAALQSIGQTGAAAFAKLQDVRKADETFRKFGTTLQATVKNIQDFGKAAGRAAKDGTAFAGALGSSFARLTGLSAGLGIAFKKVLDQFKNVGGETEELLQNADAVGLTAEEYEKLRNALAQQGIGQEEAGRVLDRFTKFLRSAAEQTDAYEKEQRKLYAQAQRGQITWQEYREQLEQLKESMGSAAQIAERYGLRLRNQDGTLRNIRDAMLGLAAGLKEADDKTQAAADGLEVFGRSGRKITQVLSQGREELEKLEKQMGLLAPTASKEVLAAITRMDDAFDNLSIFARALRRDIVGVFAPDVTRLVSTFTNVLANNRGRFLLLLQVVRAELQPAINALLGALNSPEAGDVLLRAFRLAVESVKAFGKALTQIIIPAFKAVLKAADEAATQINNLFGTELTGGALLAGLALAKFTGLLAVLTTGITAAASAVRLLYAAFTLFLPLLRILAVALLTPSGAIIALGIAIGTLVGLVIRYWPQIVAATTAAWNTVVQVTKNAWNAAALAVFQFFDAIRNFFATTVPAFFANMWAGIVSATQTAWQGVLDFFTGIVAGITARFNAIVKFFTDLWAAVVAVATQAWTAITTGATDLFNYLTTAPGAAFGAITTAAKGMYDSVVKWFVDLIAKAKEFLGLQAQAGGGPAGGGSASVSRARGGPIRGPGTGTSDSILARVSNGEWVVKARAVAHYGQAFMQRLNNMQLPQFADGGLVRVAQSFVPDLPPMPRFAAGGAVVTGGGRPMTLQIGDQVIPGLTADATAVRQLQRYAASKAVHSTGRKPLWFKG